MAQRSKLHPCFQINNILTEKTLCSLNDFFWRNDKDIRGFFAISRVTTVKYQNLNTTMRKPVTTQAPITWMPLFRKIVDVPDFPANAKRQTREVRVVWCKPELSPTTQVSICERLFEACLVFDQPGSTVTFQAQLNLQKNDLRKPSPGATIGFWKRPPSSQIHEVVMLDMVLQTCQKFRMTGC